MSKALHVFQNIKKKQNTNPIRPDILQAELEKSVLIPTASSSASLKPSLTKYEILYTRVSTHIFLIL